MATLTTNFCTVFKQYKEKNVPRRYASGRDSNCDSHRSYVGRLQKFYKYFFKWADPASFPFIFGLFKQTIQFLQQINVKNVMSIQYPALGFEPTTFGT